VGAGWWGRLANTALDKTALQRNARVRTLSEKAFKVSKIKGSPRDEGEWRVQDRRFDRRPLWWFQWSLVRPTAERHLASAPDRQLLPRAPVVVAAAEGRACEAGHDAGGVVGPDERRVCRGQTPGSEGGAPRGYFSQCLRRCSKFKCGIAKKTRATAQWFFRREVHTYHFTLWGGVGGKGMVPIGTRGAPKKGETAISQTRKKRHLAL